MASKFIAPDVKASSTLNSQQMSEFFNEMKKTVWHIRVQWKQLKYNIREEEHKFYTGVCIGANGLILTSFFDLKNLLKIYGQGPNEKQYSEVELVHHDRALGLALVRAKHLESFNHIEFALESNFYAGQHLYAIAYPRAASSSILLMGHLAYQCNPDSKFTSQNCPIYRTVKDLSTQDVYPIGLGDDVSLLQIAGLGASNEFQGRTTYRCGAPVFDATGHLTGLIAFQQAGFDFAIQVAVLKSFVCSYFPSHGQSKQPSSS